MVRKIGSSTGMHGTPNAIQIFCNLRRNFLSTKVKSTGPGWLFTSSIALSSCASERIIGQNRSIGLIPSNCDNAARASPCKVVPVASEIK